MKSNAKKFSVVMIGALVVYALLGMFLPPRFDESISSSVVKIQFIREEQLIDSTDTASTRPKEEEPLSHTHQVAEDALPSVQEKDCRECNFGTSQMDVQKARITYLPETKFDWKEWARDTANKFAFLHVGKAGGSSLYCILVNGVDGQFCKKWSSSRDSPPRITAHFDKRIHMGGTQRPTNHSVFLVSLRDPVERIISAYNYEKKIKWVQKWLPDFRRTCFPGHVQDLFLQGLSPSPPTTNNETDQEHYCWRLARNVTKGNIPHYNSHFTYNYESYEKVFLRTGKHLLAIRTNHMNLDLVHLQGLLHTGMVPDIVNVTSTDVVQVQNKGKTTVTNDGMSAEAYANACQVLCQEIQVYKRFLYRAENLDDQMVRESIHELQTICPAEGLEVRRDCGEEDR
jgi:hypothetical protein